MAPSCTQVPISLRYPNGVGPCSEVAFATTAAQEELADKLKAEQVMKDAAADAAAKAAVTAGAHAVAELGTKLTEMVAEVSAAKTVPSRVIL
jgi:hypothetical protein